MADVSGLIGNGALTAAGTLFTYLAFKQTSKDIHGLGFKCYLSGIGRTGIYSSFDLSGNNAPYGEKTINPWSLYVSPALFLVCSKLTYDSLKNGFFYAKEIKKSAKKQ